MLERYLNQVHESMAEQVHESLRTEQQRSTTQKQTPDGSREIPVPTALQHIGQADTAGLTDQPSDLQMSEAEQADSATTVHVEVQMLPTSAIGVSAIRDAVLTLLAERQAVYKSGELGFEHSTMLKENVASILICANDEGSSNDRVLLSWQVRPVVHVFQLQQEGPVEDLAEGEDVAAYQIQLLPANDLHGLWESLEMEANIKIQLLQYANSAILFSDKNVDTNIINFNRVVLLHGPPGTGKTSLCKGLAQKLSIRLGHRFRYGQLIELNAHSLFSKWFSESGKLVSRLFGQINEILDDTDTFVCLLIDEVESLTSARKAAMSGNEPSDAVRAVNAVLTNLDNLRRRKNVLILTTSNITGAIDVAFIDRADIKQYIGPPDAKACYRILSSCLTELMRTAIVSPSMQLLAVDELDGGIDGYKPRNTSTEAHCSSMLYSICSKCEGLSGRMLRKLPFITHTMTSGVGTLDLERFLQVMSQALDKEKSALEGH